MAGLRQLDAEAAVLSGLKRDLMQPAAFEAFRQDYAAALRDSVKGVGAEKQALERSLAKLDKQIANATAAILGGLNSPALLSELRKAEEQKADLVERLARIDLPEPELPKNLDEMYAERVRELETTIANPRLIQQAIDVIKILVEKVVVEERPEGGHVLDLRGDLARLLTASAPNRHWAGSGTLESSLDLVAGARNSRFLRLVESAVPRLVA